MTERSYPRPYNKGKEKLKKPMRSSTYYLCGEEEYFANQCKKKDIRRNIQQISEISNLDEIKEQHNDLVNNLGLDLKNALDSNQELDDIKEYNYCDEHSDSSSDVILVLSNEKQFFVDLIDSLENSGERQSQLEKSFALIKGPKTKPL